MRRPDHQTVQELPVKQRDKNRLLAFCREVKGDITASKLCHYLLARRQKGIVSKTLKADKSAILACLKLCAMDSLRDRAEVEEIRAIVHSSVKLHSPPTRIKASDLVTEAEMTEVMRSRSERFRLLAFFLWTTGMRPHELLALEWRSARRVENMLEFSIRGKGERIRHVLVPVDLCSRIFKTFGHYRWLFCNAKGGQLTQNALNKLFSRHGKKALGRRVYPYLFRHTFATSLIQAGNDVGAVAEFMGNSAELLVRVYLHSSLAPTMIQKQYERVA